MKLALYKFNTCPHCVRVFDYIEKSGRTDIEMHDIMNNADNHKHKTASRKGRGGSVFI